MTTMGSADSTDITIHRCALTSGKGPEAILL
jgi:hypothetical protein